MGACSVRSAVAVSLPAALKLKLMKLWSGLLLSGAVPDGCRVCLWAAISRSTVVARPLQQQLDPLLCTTHRQSTVIASGMYEAAAVGISATLKLLQQQLHPV